MTWAERIAHVKKFNRDEFIANIIPSILEQKLSAHASQNWGAADNISGTMIGLLFTHGPARVRELFDSIRHVVPQAVAGYLRTENGDDEVSVMILEMMDSTNMFEILGFDVGPEVIESFRPFLPRIPEDKAHPQWRWTKGLVAVALNERFVWGPIAGFLPDQTVPFTPGATFDGNMQGLLAHLGAARLARATFADVQPAWSSFMATADALMDARQIDYPIVPWVARIVHHDIGGQPLGTVADLLYRDIERCVASGV